MISINQPNKRDNAFHPVQLCMFVKNAYKCNKVTNVSE